MFISKIEEVQPAEELTFKPCRAFGRYRAIMPVEALAHPAKFNASLLEYLIQNYTNPGDIILDPMAGTGFMGVVAAMHGRNSIQVELEDQYYRWMEMAREQVEKTHTLTRKGWILNIHGDSRQLTSLIADYVGKIDVALTSPPYANTPLSGGDPEKRRKRLIAAGYDPRDFLGGTARNATLKHYSKGNIGRLALGNPTKLAGTGGGALEELYKSLRGRRGNPTYISEMLLIYHEMHESLRAGGKAIIVIKPYINKGTVIDLPYLTLLMLEKVGFTLYNVLKMRATSISLWQILNHRRIPDDQRIMHEYVMVCSKH